jgi:hypothetical protein
MSGASRDLYPYSLAVEPVPGKEGKWRWAIRKHGELVRRFDRRYSSQAKAAKDALAEIERLLKEDERKL